MFEVLITAGLAWLVVKYCDYLSGESTLENVRELFKPERREW